MTHNTSVTLGKHFKEFVQKQVHDGSYGTASEVVRAGLRMLEEYEDRLAALRAAIQEGIDSGPAGPLDMEEIKREARKEAGLS